ncbi:recombinase family protein [Microbacterium sp. CR_7]|uniref:recombinase family protein n=1 Tax=Microbacterium sp. CR_7 TaxID=3055792 RepID=UPI0035C17A60
MIDLYVRLSIHDDTKDGLKRQEADLRRWAERNGHTVRTVWRDPGVSAYKAKERPEFKQAVRALTSGEVSLLAVWKLDRLSRRGAGQVGVLLDDLEAAHASIYFLKDGLSTAEVSHRLPIILVSEQARSESKNTSLRINSKNDALREAGLPPLGKRRFGYLPADAKHGVTVNTVEHPEEAPIVRHIFAAYIGGASIASLASELGWRTGRVRDTLTNAAYAGTLKMGEVEYTAADHVARLVSPEDHALALARLQSASAVYRGYSPQGGQIKHLASGIARCGVCDSPVMFRNTYVCKAVPTRHISITEKSLDQLIRSRTVATLLDPDFKIDLEPGTRSAVQINADLDATERQIQDVLTGLSGGLKMSQLLPHLKPLQERQAALREELEAVSARSVQARVLADIAAAMRKSAEVWAAKPPGKRTKTLHASLAYDDLPLNQRRELIDGLFSILIQPGRGTERVQITLR